MRRLGLAAMPLALAGVLALTGCPTDSENEVTGTYVQGVPGKTKKITGTDTVVKNAVYVEVNRDNILNAGSYVLEDGTYFYDYVIIFAANIRERNCALETTEPHGCIKSGPHVHLNENVRHVLTNRDKYIKPLQDKGIKVLLGLLGDHDGITFGAISSEKRTAFIADMVQVVDQYGLDGVDFDDEWGSKEEWAKNSNGETLTGAEADAANPTTTAIWTYPQTAWSWPLGSRTTYYRDPAKGIVPGNGYKGAAPDATVMDTMWKQQGAIFFDTIKAARTALGAGKIISVYEYNTGKYITPGGAANSTAVLDNSTGAITTTGSGDITLSAFEGIVDMAFQPMYHDYVENSANKLSHSKYSPLGMDLSGSGYYQNDYPLPPVELTDGTMGTGTIEEFALRYKEAGDYGILFSYGLKPSSHKLRKSATDPEPSITLAEYLSILTEKIFGQSIKQTDDGDHQKDY